MNGYGDYDMTPYAGAMQEFRDWMSVGERTDKEFGEKFSTRSGTQPERASAVAYGENSPILGNLVQGMGLGCWAGRLHLLRLMVDAGEFRAERRGGRVIYSLA